MTVGPRWKDAEAEYRVLVDLVVPAAQVRAERWMQEWEAIDTKVLGMLAIDSGLAATLVTLHQSLHAAWWAVALGFATAGVFFVASYWPREVFYGDDLIDFHDEMRASEPLDAAREMLDSLQSVAEGVAETLGTKLNLYERGLAVFTLSALGSLPLILFRP